jgi:hypothetical protein
VKPAVVVTIIALAAVGVGAMGIGGGFRHQPQQPAATSTNRVDFHTLRRQLMARYPVIADLSYEERDGYQGSGPVPPGIRNTNSYSYIYLIVTVDDHWAGLSDNDKATLKGDVHAVFCKWADHRYHRSRSPRMTIILNNEEVDSMRGWGDPH